MKKLKLFFACLLMAVLSIGQVWAGDETATIQTTCWGAAAQAYQTDTREFTDEQGNKWHATGYGVTANTAVIIGKGGANYLETPAFSGNISSIEVTWSGNANYYLALQTTDGTELEAKSNPASPGATETFTVSGEYTQLRLVGRRSSGTSNAQATISKVVVTYAGGGSDPVAVTGVSLNKASTSIVEGKTETLVATVAPSNASDKSVSWSSDDESVATVDGGIVTAVAAGTATITVTTTDGSFTDECEVTVTEAPAAVNYEKVTAAPSDWSGEYLIVYENGATAYVWTGVDAVNCYATATISNDVIAQPEGTSSVTIASMEGGYSILVNGGTNDGKYIQNNGTSNGIKFVNAGVATTLTYENNAVTITCGGKMFRYNNASGNDRFRYFGSAQQVIQLYKKVDGTVKPSADLAFDAVQKLAKVAGTLTAPNLSTADGFDGTVTYASSDEAVVKVNASTGAITEIVAAGKAVITAHSDATENFKEGSASYTIFVAEQAGTNEDPLTEASAKALIDLGCTLNAHVAGVVASQDGGNFTVTLTNGFKFYKAKDIGNVAFESAYLKINDEVTAYGQLTKYSSTYELAEGCYLTNYVEYTEPLTPIANDKDHPYTVAQALAFAAAPATYDITEAIYIAGVVYKVDNFSSTNGTLNIYVKDAGVENQFEFYKCKGIYDESLTAFTAEDDVQVGDEVIGYGVMKHFTNATTDIWEFDDTKTGDYLVSLNRPAVAVTGVTVESTASVAVGGTVTLHAAVVPENASNKTINWSVQSGNAYASVADGVVTGIAEGTAVIRAASDEDASIYAECTVTVAPLSPWATVYTSNVEIASNTAAHVTINEEDFDAAKTSKGASATITLPQGVTKIHMHIVAWKDEAQTVSVTGDCFNEAKELTIVANDGVAGSGTTYDLGASGTDYYFSLTPDNEVAANTVITITAASNKRFVLFGANAEYPAAITLDPASKDFGEVKENASADFEFTITPNAMSTGDLVASIIGTDAAKFSASAISENKVTVTFTPGEVGGPYSASLKIVSDNAEVTAALSGTGITALTPEIGIDKDAVAFGDVKQNTTPATQSVAVTLSNIDEDGVSAAITGSVFSLSTNKLTENGSIVITPVTTTPGTYSETLTLSATGATSKNITVTMKVVDEWAYVYTSNVEIASNTAAQVTIGETNYAAAKTSKGATATITLPQGVTTIHLHLVAWKDEAQTVSVTGDCFNEAKELTIVANAGVSGSGTTYDLGESGTDYYFSLTPDNEVAVNTVITIAAASNKRFVLFGVNQEGGVLPVLESIEISGDLSTKTGYKVGDALDLDGLTVEATYSLGGVAQSPVDITSDPELELTYDPLVENQTEVTITASYKGQTDDITITGLDPVASADPKIYVSTLNVNFASVEVGESVPAAETVTVTLTNVASVTATLGGTNPEAFSITPAALTTSGDIITISILANTDAAATYSATLTISDDATENPAQSKTINLSFAVIEPVVNEEYQLVSDVNTLAAGDQIIIVAENEGDYYTLDGSISNQYFPSTAVSIAAGIITAPSTSAIILGKDGDNWTMSMGGQLIGATAAKKASLGNNDASNTWTIAIAENVATIANTTEAYGKLQFNYNNGTNPRFLNYASAQTAVAIYKKGTPSYGSYERDGLTAGNYATICLPNGGTISGAKLFDLEYYDGTSTLYLLEVNGNAMVAGRPYIFLPSAESIVVTYTDNAGASAGSFHGLIGSLASTNVLVEANAGNYILWQNAYYFVDDVAYVGANRAYIHMDYVPTQPAPQQGAPRRRVAMTVNGKDAAQGFENLDASEKPLKVVIDGTLYILRGEKVYDATGRMVK